MTADGSTGGSGATDPELYASIVEAMADGVVRFDPDGTIAFVNGAVESFLGTDRETLVGETLERLVEGDRFDRSAYERVAAAFGTIRDGDEDERRVIIETERAEALELRLCGIRTNGAIRGIVGTIRDVTRRERALETLERQQRAIYRLHQMDADGGRSVDGKLRRALDIGCEFLDLPIGFVASVDGETHRIDHVVGTDDVAVGTSRPLNSTYCRRTVEGDGPVAIRDAETELGADDPAYAETGISCYIGTETRVGARQPPGDGVHPGVSLRADRAEHGPESTHHFGGVRALPDERGQGGRWLLDGDDHGGHGARRPAAPTPL